MKALELKVPPLLFVAVIAAAMYGAAAVVPEATFLVPGRSFIAIALALIGVALTLAGVLAFRRSKTTLNPMDPTAASAVVSGGVYRFSRNPMYLGFLLALGAWAIQLSNALAAALLPVFVLYMNPFQIEPEERFLRAKFGHAYSQYSAAVRRWI